MSSETTEITVPREALTKYPQGSVRELWHISLPIMISLMSGSLMMFFDRLFLAHFSIDALNAAANAGMIAFTIQYLWISTAIIAEIFVGQLNGSGEKSKIGEPVWQMIWFSLGTSLLFFPLALYGAPFLFDKANRELEIGYFRWMMLFAPIFCLAPALSGFYIGRGRVKVVMITTLLANLINIGLDVLLIYGYEPFVVSHGITGAAIATGISQFIQVLILFIAFYRPQNRRLYGTGKYAFNKILMWKCLRIGMPNGIAHTIELLAWTAYFALMTSLGQDYILIAAVSQSIFFLFTFVTEGLSKGASAIAANMIGGKQWDLIWKLLRSGIIFYIGIFFLVGWILVLNPLTLIELFLPSSIAASTPEIKELLISACFWLWISFFLDGINWLLIGLLTAAGDTKFVMKIGSTTPWVLAIFPIYIFTVKFGFGADFAWTITAFYLFCTCCIYLWRFKSEKWKSIHIT